MWLLKIRNCKIKTELGKAYYFRISGFAEHSTLEYFSPFERETKT